MSVILLYHPFLPSLSLDLPSSFLKHGVFLMDGVGDDELIKRHSSLPMWCGLVLLCS